MIRPYVLDLSKSGAWASFPSFFLEVCTGNVRFPLLLGHRGPTDCWCHRRGEQSEPSLVPSWVVLPWPLTLSAQGLGVPKAPGETGWPDTRWALSEACCPAQFGKRTGQQVAGGAWPWGAVLACGLP